MSRSRRFAMSKSGRRRKRSMLWRARPGVRRGVSEIFAGSSTTRTSTPWSSPRPTTGTRRPRSSPVRRASTSTSRSRARHNPREGELLVDAARQAQARRAARHAAAELARRFRRPSRRCTSGEIGRVLSARLVQQQPPDDRPRQSRPGRRRASTGSSGRARRRSARSATTSSTTTGTGSGTGAPASSATTASTCSTSAAGASASTTRGASRPPAAATLRRRPGDARHAHRHLRLRRQRRSRGKAGAGPPAAARSRSTASRSTAKTAALVINGSRLHDLRPERQGDRDAAQARAATTAHLQNFLDAIRGDAKLERRDRGRRTRARCSATSATSPGGRDRRSTSHRRAESSATSARRNCGGVSIAPAGSRAFSVSSPRVRGSF